MDTGPNFSNIGTFMVPLSTYVLMKTHIHGYHETDQTKIMCVGWVVIKYMLAKRRTGRGTVVTVL